jgi:hypothetical protein
MSVDVPQSERARRATGPTSPTGATGPTVAVIACPQCGEPHAVRLNDGPAPVACGATAEVRSGAGYVRARVWPPDPVLPAGRAASVIAVAY